MELRCHLVQAPSIVDRPPSPPGGAPLVMSHTGSLSPVTTTPAVLCRGRVAHQHRSLDGDLGREPLGATPWGSAVVKQWEDGPLHWHGMAWAWIQ